MENRIPISSKYICGVEFFRLANLASLDIENYFRCLGLLLSLFDSPEFKAAILRFYINRITNGDDKRESLRLVYDTVDPERVQKIIREYIEKNKNQIAIFESKEANRPNAATPLGIAEGEDLRFRNFLHVNTLIFLETGQNYDLNKLRELIHHYRYALLPTRVPPEVVFAEPFSTSKYFQELKKNSLDKEYWKDLTHYFNKNDFGLHFLVNMSAVDEWGYDPRFFQEDWIVHK